MRERVQKVLASSGMASRRKAEDLIRQGVVSVNGKPAALGDTCDPTVDSLTVHGQAVAFSAYKEYLALNKPTGYVTTLRAQVGAATVLDLVDTEHRIFPVGRLDKDTSGLLFLTNDGAWANVVSHPSHGIEKEYVVTVEGDPPGSTLQAWERGVTLPDGSKSSPVIVRRLRNGVATTTLSLTLVEGKKRQIRHMCGAAGHQVIELQRVRVGPIRLGNMAEGTWRRLDPSEVMRVYESDRKPTPTKCG